MLLFSFYLLIKNRSKEITTQSNAIVCFVKREKRELNKKQTLIAEPIYYLMTDDVPLN